MIITGTQNKRYICLANSVAFHLGIHKSMIEIDFERESSNGADYGYCSGDCDAVSVSIYRRIFGEKIKSEDIQRTLIHELVHAEQFLSGRLLLEMNYSTWEGEDFTGVNYDESPWEIEALEREAELFKLFSVKYK